MKLNWEEQVADGESQLKEIRREAVHLFTGVGSVAGKDGIFSREQKWAANKASGLS